MATEETHTVLAGVDGSARSADAMALALTLAPHLHATARPTYVHPPGDSGQAPSDPLYGDALLTVADRSPARGLAREASLRKAALVALGASHRSLLGRVFLGGTAERLLSESPCPVAVAPKGYAERLGPLETIGCAFDGSPESRPALAWARALARASGCELRILTVHKPPAAAIPAYHGLPMVATEEAVQRDLGRRVAVATREVEADGVRAEGLVLEGHPASLLQEQSTDLDLLVVGSRGHGPSRALLLGSVARSLVRSAGCPVVVMPRHAGELP